MTASPTDRLITDLLNNIPALPDLSKCCFGVFGAGNTTVLSQNSFKRHDIKPDFYIDNSEVKHGSHLGNVDVISMAQYKSAVAATGKPPFVLICSANPEVISILRSQLTKEMIPHLTVDEFIFYKYSDELLKTYFLLEDEKSKTLFYELIKNRIAGTYLCEELISPNQYFAIPEFTFEFSNEVFVDIGAFVGDSIEQYLWEKLGVFGKIYAFEPDKTNFIAMKTRVKRLKTEWAVSDDRIVCENAAIGAVNHSITTKSSNENEASLGAVVTDVIPEGANAIPMYSIDEYFKNTTVSFIKADIESYEYDMLCGAKNVIMRDCPKLAICIYHAAADLFDIPLLINSYNKNYHFKIRQHRLQGFSDTVLYIY